MNILKAYRSKIFQKFGKHKSSERNPFDDFFEPAHKEDFMERYKKGAHLVSGEFISKLPPVFKRQLHLI